MRQIFLSMTPFGGLPNAAFLRLQAVKFDKHTVFEDVFDQWILYDKMNGHIEFHTLMGFIAGLGEPEAVKFITDKAQPLQKVLQLFTTWTEWPQIKSVWSVHNAIFIPQLRHAFNVFHGDLPFHPAKGRCLITAYENILGKEIPKIFMDIETTEDLMEAAKKLQPLIEMSYTKPKSSGKKTN